MVTLSERADVNTEHHSCFAPCMKEERWKIHSVFTSSKKLKIITPRRRVRSSYYLYLQRSVSAANLKFYKFNIIQIVIVVVINYTKNKST
jgi:hypothetical protein